jgi:hypothetical protein
MGQCLRRGGGRGKEVNMPGGCCKGKGKKKKKGGKK